MKETYISGKTRSLLRYPGGKARLAKIVAQALSLNHHKSTQFVEPFCGGASVSIALLEANVVGSIALNDIDPLISSLWECVFSRDGSKWLAEAVMEVPLSLDYWQYQKNNIPKNLEEAALKCLYLNRTSFSGILQDRAGPIGGRSQNKWTVGCRFNREKLSRRIRELSSLSSRVSNISNMHWKEFCQSVICGDDVFLYLDPPFYCKANRLYRYSFVAGDHVSLFEYLKGLRNPWILSYDNASTIRRIYDNNGFNSREIDNTYSAHPVGGNSFVGKEILYSNLRSLPNPPLGKSGHAGLSVRAGRRNILEERVFSECNGSVQ